MISLQDLEKVEEVVTVSYSSGSLVSQGSKRKSSSLTESSLQEYKWSKNVESLISFHFSLIPFFESKQESDKFLIIKDGQVRDTSSPSMTPGVSVAIQEDNDRIKKLDSVFVKVIFPFIERRIDEEGVWRKSGNFSRIKKIQRELIILINGRKPKAQAKEIPSKKIGSMASVNKSMMSIVSTSSYKNKGKGSASSSSMGSLASSSSLSASRSSLDEIDEDENCEYSVHDMTILVKRILLPSLQESKAVIGFLSLVNHISTRIPIELLSKEPFVLRDKEPRTYANIISSLSLYLMYHQKTGHDIFTDNCQGDEEDSLATNFMTLFVCLFDLLKYTTLHSNENKMTSASIATLFLPHLYPDEHETMESKESEKSRQQHFMLCFMIEFWPQIRSQTALPKTFLTDFQKNQESRNKKRRSNSSSEQTSFQGEEEEEVMQTCVRFCAETPSKPTTGGIGETELELARLYAHVQSTQDKKMIKKLNRAGVVIPVSGKKSKINPGLDTPSTSKTPKTKISSSLKAIFSSAKKKSTKKRLLTTDSPSSYDIFSQSKEKDAGDTSVTTPSHSFEVLRFT